MSMSSVSRSARRYPLPAIALQPRRPSYPLSATGMARWASRAKIIATRVDVRPWAARRTMRRLSASKHGEGRKFHIPATSLDAAGRGPARRVDGLQAQCGARVILLGATSNQRTGPIGGLASSPMSPLRGCGYSLSCHRLLGRAAGPLRRDPSVGLLKSGQLGVITHYYSFGGSLAACPVDSLI
jgi:hypothetical protein